MAILNAEEKAFAVAIGKLAYGNPFLPERIDAEKEALGKDFVPIQDVWSVRPGDEGESPNVLALAEKTERILASIQSRIKSGSVRLGKAEVELYRDIVLYALYYRHQRSFYELFSAGAMSGQGNQAAPFYRDFVEDMRGLMSTIDNGEIPETDVAHLFACFYQIRRAFANIFRYIIGGSLATARLRASVWQSIFTHDVRRYRRSLFQRMRDIPTLITGPSGTGKELVARAVALSGYVPFKPESCCFEAGPGEVFFPLNLSALSPALIESELFGHRKGAFTGAQSDHAGWLESCGMYGTVFLDEIGETDLSIQVKLLRVLETRRFQRLGETVEREFCGKIVAATNRDLGKEISEGRFREDFYYRLCADMIRTPSLKEQVSGTQAELADLVLFLCRRVVTGEDTEILRDEVMDWIRESVGYDYPWPGNVRELDQCVRNIMIRREYHPPRRSRNGGLSPFLAGVEAGSLTMDELTRQYVTRIYAETGSYQETARRLNVDHRTVKGKLDDDLLEELGAG